MFIAVTDRETECRILLNTASVSSFEDHGQFFDKQADRVKSLGTMAYIAAPYRDEVRDEGGDRIHLSESFDRIKELLREAGELA